MDGNANLEKGSEAFGDNQFERALNTGANKPEVEPTISRGVFSHGYDGYSKKQEPLPSSQHADGGQEDKQANGQGKDKEKAAQSVIDIDPAADRLAQDPTFLSEVDFYELMGLNVPVVGLNASVPPKEGIGQIAKPHGLYSKIYRTMRYAHRKYKIFEVAAYVLLILQLFLSAVFIILGSLTHVDTHLTIAILGAVATVVAGALALMKGQGLPNRLRQARDSFRSVLFEAEELYWDVRAGRQVQYKDIKKLREDYLRVLEAQKMNHPDTWTDTDGGMDKTIGGKVLRQPGGKKS